MLYDGFLHKSIDFGTWLKLDHVSFNQAFVVVGRPRSCAPESCTAFTPSSEGPQHLRTSPSHPLGKHEPCP